PWGQAARGPEEPGLHRRHGAGLRARRPQRGLPVQQPERARPLWLRRVLPRLTVNLHSSDFELFGLPQRFAQERSGIDARWKELQREAHPDRFAAQGASAQRAALQWSVRINEAYQ